MPAIGDTIRWWGATDAERARPLTADGLVPGGIPLVRAVDVAAPAPVTFRWVCQIRVAPYSYDLIDNGGRRSPQELTPGADEIEIGDVWSRIFRVRAFEPGESVTLEHRGPVFGHVAMTYRVTPRGTSGSRLVMRLAFRAPGPGPVRRLVTAALSAGDLVMARRQLLNLKRLAEAQQAR